MHILLIYMGLAITTVGGVVIVKQRPIRRVLGAAIIVAGFLIGSLVANQPTVAAGKSSTQGVPLVANDNMIAVKTLDGQAIILNAEDTPVLFFSPQSSSSNLIAVQSDLNAIKGTHRPVILIGTSFHNPAKARRETEAFLKREHITMPVVIQEGPPTLYVKTVPTMVAMQNGRWVQYHGISAIISHLRSLAVITTNRQTVVKKANTKG